MEMQRLCWRQPGPPTTLHFISFSLFENERDDWNEVCWGLRAPSGLQKLNLFDFWWSAESNGRAAVFSFWVGVMGRPRPRQPAEKKDKRRPSAQLFFFPFAEPVKQIEKKERERRERRANKPQMNSWICGLWACRSSPRKHPFIDFIHHSINSFGFLGCSAEKRQAHTNKQPKKRGHPTLSLLWVDCWLRVWEQ